MADNSLNLPGDFDPAKNYLMSGKTLKEWKMRIEADRVVPGPGILESGTAKGRMFRVVFPPTEWPPFALREMEKDGTDYKLTFEPGRVIVANPVGASNSGDGYEYYVPEIAGLPMDEKQSNGELPTLTVSPGQGVYVSIMRDEMGMVIPPVELLADAKAAPSDHYQPEDPEGSGHISEVDLVRILDLDLVSGEVEIKVWRESDIQLTPFLWTGENLGEHARVYKDYDETTGIYRFRTLRGCFGIDLAEDGDTIKVEFDGENVGDGGAASSGEGAEIYIPKDVNEPPETQCATAAKFRSLLQGLGLDEKQIRITLDGDNVRLHGNGKNGSLVFLSCAGIEAGRIEWEDGLITSQGDIQITVGDCSGSGSI